MQMQNHFDRITNSAGPRPVKLVYEIFAQAVLAITIINIQFKQTVRDECTLVAPGNGQQKNN
jgi:hypothetical protein